VSQEIAVSEAVGSVPQIRGIAFALGFFFSFRLAIVLLSVNLFGLEPGTGSALSLGLDLLLFIVVCFRSIGEAPKSATPIVLLPAMRWVLGYLIFAALSLVWSETASLANSLAYWFGLALDVANVTLYLRMAPRGDEACSMMKGFIWSSCLLAVVAWIMPVQPDLRLGDEQFFNTNEIGNLCAMAIFFMQYLTRRNHERWRVAKLLLILTLIRSLSKSTLLAFLVGQGVLLLLDRSTSRRTKIITLAGALVMVLAFWGLFADYYGVYTTAGNQAETLTGRTAIWLYVVNSAFDHPWTAWIGHGFDSWWKVVPPFGIESFEARHAENEILQQFYAYGIAGVVLLAGVYGSIAQQLRRLAPGPEKLVFLAFLSFVVVRGLAVADAFDFLLPAWAIAMMSILIDRARAGQSVLQLASSEDDLNRIIGVERPSAPDAQPTS
jgi:exopolysaccharide production protein ExoQ